MSIATSERQKYEDIWTLEDYGTFSPGEKYLPLFIDMAHPEPNAFVLDAGCGSGKGMLALVKAGFLARGCDFTRAGLVEDAQRFDVTEGCLWNDPAPLDYADHVYCCDVLEHIPTAFTMLVVSQLLKVAQKSAFFSICFLPDGHGAWIGKALHETVKSYVWWRDNLATVGELVESRDLLNNGVFLVRPR